MMQCDRVTLDGIKVDGEAVLVQKTRPWALPEVQNGNMGGTDETFLIGWWKSGGNTDRLGLMLARGETIAALSTLLGPTRRSFG